MPAAPAPPPPEIDKDTIACPACGGRVRAGAKFCTHCGTSLAVACPECGHAVSSDDRFCSRCGAELSGAGRPTEAVQVDSAN
ncbi:MAG: zinc ribbon domain-containing protein [Chloroflexi bacterium]|nr:MAG: zinc ribbon domain-containing protein [Chloroflexota bacterium]